MNRALGAPVCGPEYAFGKKPNEFLKSCKSLLPLTGALAVADGEGLNGVWLAERGVHVLAVDFSPSAQRKARALAKERLTCMNGITRSQVSMWWSKYSLDSARRPSGA